MRIDQQRVSMRFSQHGMIEEGIQWQDALDRRGRTDNGEERDAMEYLQTHCYRKLASFPRAGHCSQVWTFGSHGTKERFK